MDLFKLTIHEKYVDEFQIALVDDPAIESNWQAFSKQQQAFKVQDEDRRIVAGYAMIADMEIPRWEPERGAYNVTFTKESIWDIALKFFKNSLTNNTNEMHDSGNLSEGVFVFGSMIIDKDMGVTAPIGFDQEADGSWFIFMKVDNDEIWEKVKAGEYVGFSIECRFKEELVSPDVNDLIEDLKSYIS
jgi:hypothetical protein